MNVKSFHIRSLLLACLAIVLLLGAAETVQSADLERDPVLEVQQDGGDGLAEAGSVPINADDARLYVAQEVDDAVVTFGLGDPPDAQSTTGPTPPPDVEVLSVSAVSQDAVLIPGVPAYIWHHGCGPTAAGMVIGYWDMHGFSALVPGDSTTQTADVNEMIASEGPASNYTDYCLPMDSTTPSIVPDLSEPPPGDEHADECIADYMKTSQSASNNRYGWSWFSHMGPAMDAYVEALGQPGYDASVTNLYWSGGLNWDSYRGEIDAGRPVVFLVDTNGDGRTDHFVTAIGYDEIEGTERYACLNTWDTGVHWFDFAPIASGQPWGIYGAVTLQFAGVSLAPSAQTNQGGHDQVVAHEGTLFNNTGASDSFDLTLGSHVWDTTLSTDSLGPIANGDSLGFTVYVTVPTGAGWYSSDTVVVSATSLISPTVYSDTATFTTQAYVPPQISVSPDALASTQNVGEVVDKLLTIHNGNGVTLTFDIEDNGGVGLSAGIQAGWTYSTTKDNQDNAHTGNPDGDMDTALCGGDAKEPIEFDIWVDRVPGPTGNTLSILSHDVDPGEIDQVSLNGVYLGDLVGNDNTWAETELEIPAGVVVAGQNLVEVDLQWCITLDWGRLFVAGTPVPWLDETPTSGSVLGNSSEDVTVTFDATGIQPGEHRAFIYVDSNDPVSPTVSVPVSMTVLATANMGWVEGTVTDKDTGDPLEATVAAVGQPYGVTTDPVDGTYKLWLDAGSETLQVTADGYLTESAPVEIVAQQGVTQDFSLELNVPALMVSPESLIVIHQVGDVTSRELTIANGGPGALDYRLHLPTDSFLLLPLDEPAGATTFLDLSGHGNDGTCSGTSCPTAGVPGRLGTALEFDGVNDRVDTPLDIDQSSASVGVTMMAWVYPTSTSAGRHHVISSDDGGFDWSILREGGTWHVFTGEGSRSTGLTVDLNQWQHVAAVWIPGTGVRFYKNGQEVTVPYLGYNASDNDLAIGDNPGPWVEHIKGQIDEVQVYHRPLSKQEVVAIYQGNPVSWLSLDPASGSVPAGSSTPVQVTFDATGVQPGAYSARIAVRSNDLANPLLVVPATMFAGAAWNDVPCDVDLLKAAIHLANANGGPDTLNLAAGCTYTLTAIENTTNGPNGLPSITSEITINGNGATIERSDAAGTPPFRILHVESTGNLTLNELTLRNGDAGSSDGGGLLNRGVATITSSIVFGNDSGSDGGGISCLDGETTLIGSTVSGNTSAGTGGGITHSSNRTMRIENSTVSDNETQGTGGGIFNDFHGDPQALEIVNSTIAGNRAAESGGVAVDAGPVTFVNCTVSGNTATQQGGGIGYAGGLDEVSLVNTILALNTAPTGPDCVVPVTSLGHNLIGDPTGCTIALQPGDLTGDPGLDAYSDDGTPGRGLFPLLPESRAIDAGDDSACLATDQRGLPRPQDGDGDGIPVCDIGAYELEAETNIELDAFTATAGVGRVTLAWETGSEVDTAGFYLWRSETESGTYTRVTDALIPAKGDAVSGASYTYVNDGLEPGETYYYKLEEVPTNGKGRLHGPVWATVKHSYSLYLPMVVR